MAKASRKIKKGFKKAEKIAEKAIEAIENTAKVALKEAKRVIEEVKPDNKEIQYSDFAKLDLRVAKILKAEEIKGADKLLKLEIDVGVLGKRTLVAGIKQHYSVDSLIGKKIIIVANLAPRKLKGIESKGMLLAASNEEHSKVILLTTDEDIDEGSSIS